MKKLLLLIVLGTLSLSNYAQISAGAGICFATEIETIGITVAGTYAINDKIEAAAAFTLFPEKDYVSWKVLDIDAHYYFTEASSFKIYGLAGLSMNFWTIDLGTWGKTTGNSTGLNLGVGAKYAVSEKLSIIPDARYTFIEGGNYFRIGATAQIAF